MNCDHFLLLISGHLDGVNSSAEELQLQEHLQECEKCRELLSAMEDADRRLRGCKVEPPAELTQRIFDAVAQEPRKKKRSGKRPAYFGGLATGLAAAVLIFAFTGNLPILKNSETEALETEPSLFLDEALMNEAAPFSADGFLFRSMAEDSADDVGQEYWESAGPSYASTSEPTQTPSLPSTAATETAPSEAVTDAPATSDTTPPESESNVEPSLPSAPEDESNPPMRGNDRPPSNQIDGSIRDGDGLPGGLASVADALSKEAENSPILMIWNASPDEIGLLKDQTPVTDNEQRNAVFNNMPAISSKNDKEEEGSPLLDRFLSLLCTGVPENAKAAHLGRYRAPSQRDPSFTVTAYEVSFDTMNEVFMDCAGTYELSAYYPGAGLNTGKSAVCTVFVVALNAETE